MTRRMTRKRRISYVRLSFPSLHSSFKTHPHSHPIPNKEVEIMASVSMAMPLTSSASQRRLLQKPTSEAFFQPLRVKPSKKSVAVKPKPNGSSRLEVKASLKEKALTGLTAAALTASMVIPEAAEAASSFSPSLKNFLLSIAAGGVVLSAIVGAVIGVANFDPVKRT